RFISKLSYKANNSNNIEGFFETDHYNITGRDFSSTVPLEATVTEQAPNYTVNTTWTSLLSATNVLDVRFSGFWGYFNLDPLHGADTPGHLSLNTGLSSVNAAYTDHENRSRAQVNASFSHHAADFIHGSHDFKFGLEFEHSKVHSQFFY